VLSAMLRRCGIEVVTHGGWVEAEDLARGGWGS
jgi:hypothetical protein